MLVQKAEALGWHVAPVCWGTRTPGLVLRSAALQSAWAQQALRQFHDIYQCRLELLAAFGGVLKAYVSAKRDKQLQESLLTWKPHRPCSVCPTE